MAKPRNLLDKIRGENRSPASYKANPYMTPSLAPRRWSTWMSNIFIAVILVLVGIVLLCVSPEEKDFFAGGWACIAVGGAFLLLGFCWYKSIQSHEEAEKLVEAEEDPERAQSPTSLNTSTTRLSEEDECVNGNPGSPPDPGHLSAKHEARRPSGQSVRSNRGSLKSNMKSSNRQGHHVNFK